MSLDTDTKNDFNKNKKSNDKFWIIFWITIILFAIVTIYSKIIPYIEEREGNQSIGKGIEGNQSSVVPSPIRINCMRANFSELERIARYSETQNDQNISREIDDQVDKIFNQYVYVNVESYLDYKFSVTTEYKEMLIVLIGQMENDFSEKYTTKYKQELAEKLIPADFDDKLQNIILESSNDLNNNIKDIMRSISNKLSNNISLSQEEQVICTNSFKKLDILMNQNIQNSINSADLNGLGVGGGVAGVVAAKMVTKKLAQKATIKASVKVASKVTLGVVAATAGLACGVAAPICAIGAATIAWFSTDYALMEIDETLHRQTEKDDLVASIKEVQEEVKKDMKNTLLNINTQITNELLKESKQIAETPIIDLVNQ